MLDLKFAKRLVIAQGAKRVYDCFKGAIPGNSMTFELGDIFTIPTNFEIYEERIGNISNQFILVETENGDVRKLYPSQLSRKVVSNVGDTIVADGTASRLYKQYYTVADGMDALRGRTIRVSNIVRVLTEVNNVPCQKTVYTFDLV